MSRKTVLITGASSGIGEQTAYEFARDGYGLVITYNRNQEQGTRVAKECQRLGAPEVSPVQLNITDDQSIKEAVEQAVQKYETIDILVNNAGVLASGYLTEQSYEDIDRQIATNLGGMIKFTKQCLPYVKEAIINIGSVLGTVGKQRLATYSATKFGVRGFSQSLAKELPSIRVYAVNPGLTATQMSGNSGIAPVKVARIIKKAALGKYWAPSGADITVRDYLHGGAWRYFRGVYKSLNRLIKVVLGGTV